MCLFDLVDKGVRVVFVPCLQEKWLYFKRHGLLLIDEGVSEQEQAAAEHEVTSALHH